MASPSSSRIPLPNEILSLVADNLRQSDLYCCQLVCRGWYSVFRAALYRSVDTDLDPSTLARTDIPFQCIRYLQWHPRSNHAGKEGIVSLLEKTRLLQNLHVPYPVVFRHLNVTSSILSRLSQLTLDDLPAFSIIAPLLSSLQKLRCLSLSCLSPHGGDLALADLDAIVRHAPELSKLTLKSHTILCSNSTTLLATRVHRRLTFLRIAFQLTVSESAQVSAGDGAASWLFYLSRTFPALQHLTLAGNSGGGYGSDQSLSSSDTTAKGALFLACTALSCLTSLTELRLIHLRDFIHPDLYPLLVRHRRCVQLVGGTGGRNDEAWLSQTLTSLQDHTTHLSMTLVYPRALCSSPILQRIPLTSLSIGRTSGFCSNRDHWQLPLNEILTHTPHLVHLAFYQVTLSFPVGSEAVVPHGLKRLRLKHVVLTSDILEQCGRRCLGLHTLEMIGCKWMDPVEQAGGIPFPANHCFRTIEIQDSGHLYNLHPYQLLTIHDQWILAPKQSVTGSTNLLKQQHDVNPDDFGDGLGSSSSPPQKWKQFKAWQKQQSRWTHIDPELGLSQDVACHGYVSIRCHSVDQLYFNGSSRIVIPSA
ncbi:hypothetical protein BX666DRAFT_2023871 [Dichotomocladium elegans]|nr:hypothetical protein BX666DRAFT_2023871 [Dichotomocladium elegans]